MIVESERERPETGIVPIWARGFCAPRASASFDCDSSQGRWVTQVTPTGECWAGLRFVPEVKRVSGSGAVAPTVRHFSRLGREVNPRHQ